VENAGVREFEYECLGVLCGAVASSKYNSLVKLGSEVAVEVAGFLVGGVVMVGMADFGK
jgi:hypothetical protein